MRILKEPEVRRNEILDAAEALFTTQGYRKTTIIDILNETGIAKGTFYYYFKSKEEVLDAIISRYTEQGATAAQAVLQRTDLTLQQKFLQIFMGLKPRGDDHKAELTEQLHETENAEFHLKSLRQMVLMLTPILSQLVEESIRTGMMNTPYPHESVEYSLVATQMILDEGIFQWSAEELQRKVSAHVFILERILGAEPGSMSFILEIFAQSTTEQKNQPEEKSHDN